MLPKFTSEKRRSELEVASAEIKACRENSIILDNGKDKKEVTLLTGQKLSELDTSFFEKEHYDIESYTLYNKENNEIRKMFETQVQHLSP